MVPKGWISTTIGNIAHVTSGGTPSRSVAQYWNGTIPWVTTGKINFNTIFEADEKITDDGLKNSSAKLFPPNTLLVALYGDGVTRGKVAILGIEAATNQACAAILPSTKVRHDYLFYFITSKYAALRRESAAGSQANLSGNLIKSFPVLLPPEQEQRNIAKILSTWDEAIELTERRIAATRQRKNCSMAMCFGRTPAERQNQPARSGSRTVSIGDLVSKRNETSSDLNQFPLYSFTIENGVTEKTDRYERSFLLKDRENNEYAVVRLGDFVLNPMNLRFGAIGRSQTKIPVAVSAYYDVFHVTDQDCDPLFFEYLLKSPSLMRTYESVSTGSLIEKKRVHFSEFQKIKVAIPSMPEQLRIAGLLSGEDMQVRLLTQKVAALKKQKSELMRQLFSGRLRVNGIEVGLG